MSGALLDEVRLREAIRIWARESGNRMQVRRIALKHTQDSLADAVGVRAQTISKAELGVIVPKDSVRVAIAAALLCEVQEIWPYPDRAYITRFARSVA